ncbi:hypothetical protein EHW97_05165 [Aeromicrobium camelliae]|uniref:Uncharacterized protein n=1 Tax=Aeromicrobium camelliae TaxID=1538144 RepID=A0A3N6ZG38_9ACTN|nr:hypothetical protein [Aeromicrobium camelliae]RQN09081.1 hypothetical protein EHW97_05165 [Aeromicrobium camelliae]
MTNRARVLKAERRRDLERRARDCRVSTLTVREATTLIDRWSWTDDLIDRLTSSVGRPRYLAWRGFFSLLVVHAMRTRGTMVLTEVLLTALAMDDKQRRIAGLPPFLEYHHVEGNFTDWRNAFEETVDRATGEIFPPRIPYSVDQLITDLLNATAPPFLTQYSSLAADGTAIESPYRRRSRAKDGRPDVAQGQLPVDASESAPAVATPGWPRVGVDGRAQHTVDPDAREGYRSPKPGQTKVYIGYEPTTLCDVPGIGARSRYTLIRAIAMRPAGSDRCEAGLAAVDTLPSPPEELIVDRGYSYTKEFGAGLVHRGIGMVADLHKNQRTTRPGPRAGTVFIDGQLFTAAVPKDQRSLATFPQGATQDERLAVAATYDKRSAYAFKPFGRPRSSGSQRFRGPALEGRVRCVNTPASMRKPETAKRPTTNCVPGQPCGCGITVTLPVRDYARTHQTKIYGTTAWLKLNRPGKSGGSFRWLSRSA